MTEWSAGQVASLDLKAIGEKIRTIYNQRKFKTETEFAESIGVKQSKISAAMNGDMKLTVEQYSALAIQSGISLDDLLCLPGRTSNKLAPRDVCKMLSDIYNSDYKFEIEGSPEAGITLTFSSVSADQLLPHHQGASYKNVERGAINDFLSRLEKITALRNAGSAFDDEMYNTLLEKYLNDVPEAMESAERQIEWNKENDSQYEKHVEFERNMKEKK